MSIWYPLKGKDKKIPNENGFYQVLDCNTCRRGWARFIDGHFINARKKNGFKITHYTEDEKCGLF
jgi:hypothetical protein